MDLRQLSIVRRRREVLGAVVSVAVIIVAVWLMASPGSSGNTPAAGGKTVRVGKEAPSFIVETLSGPPFELAAQRGKPIWINIWASWCPPCRAEFPDVVAVSEAGAKQGLVFIAMNFQEDRAAVESYLANTRYSFPVGLDPDGSFARLYRVLGLPTHIFIAADGTLQTYRNGGMTRGEMEEQVARLLGTPVAVAAAPATTATPASALTGDEDLRLGAALYNGQCLNCHGGPEGQPRVPYAPPHTNEGHTWHHADSQLMQIILEGFLGNGTMPPFKEKLTEDEVRVILAYIKSWWGPDQRAFQEEASRGSGGQ